MRHLRLFVLVLGLSFINLASALAQGTATESAAVDRIFNRWAAPESPGCAVAVGREGRTILARAYGMADLEREASNTVSTIFEAGSVSKQFTAAAIILLAAEGRLSLDDDVRTHIPELPDYGTPITIRHLIHHTSGLRDWGAVASAGGWPRTRRAHTNAHALEIIARQRALNYEPGAEYSYTNSGYNLMAIIVERVSGESLADYTRRTIFEPLGMESTSWRDDFTRIVKGRAQAYRAERNGYSILMPFEDVHGNGGLLTTVGDLLIWNENLETGKVGGREFIEEMHRAGRLRNGRAITYAGGLMLGRHRGTPEVSHSGSTAGYQAFLTRFPEKRLSVAVLCNATGTNPGRLARQTADVFLPELATAASEPREAEPAPAARTRPTYSPSATELAWYAGEYYSDEAEAGYTVVVSGDAVELHRRPGTVLRLTATERDAFRAANGWTVHFRRDDAGRVTGLSLGMSRVRDLPFPRVKGAR